MLKTYILSFAAVLCLLFPAAVHAMGSKEEVKTAPAYTEAVPGPTEKLSIMTAAGKRHDFNVEVVSERETMMQGLMFRSSMPADHGMLFAFPSEGERGFWMKNTYIPLDIVFIGADGKIQNIGYGKPESLETVRSTGPVLHVLELNAGTAEKLGFGPGDVVNHGAFGNPLEE